MKKIKFSNVLIFILLLALSVVFLIPIVTVIVNSFKDKFSISQTPFVLPNSETFVGIENYISGINDTGFLSALFWSLFITVCSVAVIVLFTSMTAWYITRIKTRFNSLLYYLFVFSMIVPFQMVMFTMSKMANVLRLDNPVGLIFIYLGFGAGLSVFMFTGFVKGSPIAVEESAMIDGAKPLRVFFSVVLRSLN